MTTVCLFITPGILFALDNTMPKTDGKFIRK